MSKSAITTDTPIDPGDLEPGTGLRPPIHPGEMLRLEFMEPLGLTAYGLARALGVPRTRIERLLREETGVTPDTALRLARYFRVSPESWLTLQMRYDLAHAGHAAADDIARIQPGVPRPLAAE
ncbi:MAG: HigA family addiction module antitoxin [Phreatobacter sp.]